MTHWWLLAALALGGPAVAKEKMVTFKTYPPEAEIILEDSTPGGTLLGRSGRPIPVPIGSTSGALLKFTLKHPDGEHSEVVNVEALYFESRSEWPESGVHTIPASSLRATVKDWFRYPTPTTYVGFALVLGSVLGAVAIAGRHRHLRVRHDKLKHLESKVLEVDPHLHSLVGPYRLVGRLGKGGYGTVYRAVPDKTLDENQAVAIKMIEMPDDPAERERVRREVSALEKLIHPNVIRLLGQEEIPPYRFLILELVEGTSLREQVLPGGCSPREAWTYLGPVMQAIEYCHSKNITHRDLKPDNVLLRRDGLVKLIDFGLARGDDARHATVTGQALGTPLYMSPEQWSGNPLPASDQWALGVMWFEFLAGYSPFSLSQDLVMGIFAQPTPDLPPSVPPSVSQVVHRMLEKDPANRFRTVSEAAEAMQAAIRQAAAAN